MYKSAWLSKENAMWYPVSKGFPSDVCLRDWAFYQTEFLFNFSDWLHTLVNSATRIIKSIFWVWFVFCWFAWRRYFFVKLLTQALVVLYCLWVAKGFLIIWCKYLAVATEFNSSHGYFLSVKVSVLFYVSYSSLIMLLNELGCTSFFQFGLEQCALKVYARLQSLVERFRCSVVLI